MIASSFLDALLADGPASDRTERMGLYAFLVGSWTMDATVHFDDGTAHHGTGEVHAFWVLAGRAIQDVWILPGLFHGTTLRIYDAALDAWHILWHDPLKQYYTRQTGRARDGGIVQTGWTDAGEAVRWSFTEMTPDSFRWLGERSRDSGRTWTLQADFRVRRVSAHAASPVAEELA
ncbi:hypothetical protein [Elioraea sp.]|uniref:hypothetical protein n=1 Tax=Elioraea sp. TaxID=2185103 RepID=UPI003F70FAE4